jgi:hypothetical protein
MKMAETFRQRETAKPPETRLAPTIQKEQRELHGPLDVLARGAENLRVPYEQTRQGGPKAVARSDMDMTVARNVSGLRLDGSAPLHARFQRLIESI